MSLPVAKTTKIGRQRWGARQHHFDKKGRPVGLLGMLLTWQLPSHVLCVPCAVCLGGMYRRLLYSGVAMAITVNVG